MNRALIVAAFVLFTTDALSVSTGNPTMAQTTTTTVTRTGDMEITIRRRFAAPPARIFAALTTPDLLRRWMSAAGRQLVECQVDLRPGGTYRYVFRASNGKAFAMSGTYREVVPQRRLVHTESYDGYDWEPLVTTTVLAAHGDGTTLVMTLRYPTKEICDTDFPNVESGSADGFTRLETLLAQ
jgi:uncharacterized protein YndB with AHSA1/START domain